MVKHFHICLRSGPRWLTPPPSLPLRSAWLSNIRFFYAFPNDTHAWCGGVKLGCQQWSGWVIGHVHLSICPMSYGHVQLSTTLSTSSSSSSTCLSDGRATDNEDREQCVSVNFSEWLDVPLYVHGTIHPHSTVQCLQSPILQVQSRPEKGFDWKYLILWDQLCRMRGQTFHRSLTIRIYHYGTFLRGKSGLRQQFYYIFIFFVWLGEDVGDV